ncbi:hypothetical protein L596_019966 [Steinernema carpocapsae]|nr:hypothetical protein L596_019966 [Steinernema carpocapsae]
MKCIHRDIAARNCLLSTSENKQVVKISDFGLSTIGDAKLDDPTTKMAIRWLAPEILQDFIFSHKTLRGCHWNDWANKEREINRTCGPSGCSSMRSSAIAPQNLIPASRTKKSATNSSSTTAWKSPGDSETDSRAHSGLLASEPERPSGLPPSPQKGQEMPEVVPLIADPPR